MGAANKHRWTDVGGEWGKGRGGEGRGRGGEGGRFLQANAPSSFPVTGQAWAREGDGEVGVTTAGRRRTAARGQGVPGGSLAALNGVRLTG